MACYGVTTLFLFIILLLHIIFIPIIAMMFLCYGKILIGVLMETLYNLSKKPKMLTTLKTSDHHMATKTFQDQTNIYIIK